MQSENAGIPSSAAHDWHDSKRIPRLNPRRRRALAQETTYDREAFTVEQEAYEQGFPASCIPGTFSEFMELVGTRTKTHVSRQWCRKRLREFLFRFGNSIERDVKPKSVFWFEDTDLRTLEWRVMPHFFYWWTPPPLGFFYREYYGRSIR